MTSFAPDSDRSILSHTLQYVLVLHGYHFVVRQQRESRSPRISALSRFSACSVSIFKYASALTHMRPYMFCIQPNSMSLSQRSVHTFAVYYGYLLACICGLAIFISRNSPWCITCDTLTCIYCLLSSGIHPYSVVTDGVSSSFRTSTESIAEST
jgi:hypothetical protein